MDATLDPPDGRLADNVVYFARALRAAGLPVGPGQVVEALDTLAATGIGERADLYWTLHAIFVKRHDHSVLYDQAFRLFWRRRAALEKLMAMQMPAAPAFDRPDQKPLSRRVEDALFAGVGDKREREPPKQVEIDARFTVSDSEILQKKDFAQMSAAELAQARREIADLVLPLEMVRTRRFAPDRRGRRIDPRASLRASFGTGGDSILLRYRAPKERHPPLVCLLDISGSMSDYTRLFLHFLHAVTDARKRVSSFLFGTRLSNITRDLAHKDPDEALAACSDHVKDWAGGTRIATSLHLFNRQWSRRVLAQGAVVLLITDGLERDVDESLAFEMDRLHRSCRRLIWLNPLLRFDAFEARARGIKAMLPHVDEFRPIHNLAAMADLCRALSKPADGRSDPKRWLGRVA